MYMRWVSALFLAVALSSPASARTLTVDQAVQLAVDHSLTIDAAEFGEQRAQAEATEALLQFFPRLSTTASYTRLDPVPYVEFDTSEFLGGGDTGGGCDNIDPETLPPGFTEEMARDFCEMMMVWFAMDTGDSGETQRIEMGRADNWAVGGSLEQIVFAGGALHQSRAGSMDMLRASTEQVRLAKHQTAFDAEQGFSGLVAARRATEMTGEAVELVEAYVTDLRNLSEVGMASRGFATVVKGSKNQAAAEWYINQLVSEGMQEILHTKNGIVPVNEKVQNKYSGSPKTDKSGEPFLMLSPQQIANLYYMDYSNFSMQEWTKKWNRAVAR